MKTLVIFFNGVITLVVGASTLGTGLNGAIVDYNRWTVGVGCVVFGALCTYYSGVWHEAFGKRVRHTIKS